MRVIHDQSETEPAGRVGRLQCAKTLAFNVARAPGLSIGAREAFSAAVAGRRVLMITSPTVHSLYGDALTALLSAEPGTHQYEVFPLGEARKHMRTVERVCELAARMKLDRRGLVVAVGGGVCSDIVTFGASMIRRGIDHLRIPTTLIGQVDAGIGIKGAVNLQGLKSFIGCFHPPAGVLLDRAFLQSLSVHAIREGLAEILKMALIRDAELFAQIERCGTQLVSSRFQAPTVDSDQIVDQSIRLMLAELQQNPFEDLSSQRLVDMGHTFSPTLEERSRFRISHGDAVAVDMALTCAIGAELGLMSVDEAERFIALLVRLGMPVVSPLLTVDACTDAIRSVVAHRRGHLNLVTPMRIGAATFLDQEPLTSRLLKAALARVAAFERELHSAAVTPAKSSVRFLETGNATPAL